MGDRYTITERVDQGGMAEVFRGVAESIQGFKKNVAIKRILPSLTANEKFVAMFLDEAKLSLYLQHANIVQVFDINMSDNTYFLVMEYVDGVNLKHLLERLRQQGRRIEPAHAIYLAIEACKALNYAHNLENPENHEPLNIVHRDISPPNILVSRMGEVKLVDFGLAKANSQLESTDPGVVKGKFSYLSPEAASGQQVDHRADIFAVGILLWEMFTGRRLFYGDTDYQTVELVRQARIPSVSAVSPDIEPELEDIVRKSLAQNPEGRYQQAADLGDALSQYLFSRRMKVTARDIAALVRDAQVERARQRSLRPKETLIDELIQDEMAKITSLIDGEQADEPDAAGSMSLDPSSFVDTSMWASDFGFEAPGPGADPSASGSYPGQDPSASDSGHQAISSGSLPAMSGSHPAMMAAAEPEALSQILEPDRTGLHGRAEASRALIIALAIAVILACGIGVTLFLFKDRLFGAADDAALNAPATTVAHQPTVAQPPVRG